RYFRNCGCYINKGPACRLIHRHIDHTHDQHPENPDPSGLARSVMRQQIQGKEKSEREGQPEPLDGWLMVQVGLNEPEDKIDQPDGMVVVKPVPPCIGPAAELPAIAVE